MPYLSRAKNSSRFLESRMQNANIPLKLRGYSLTYEVYPDAISETNIDFSKELLGVIEYLQTNTKTFIFKDRVVKDW